MGIIKDFRIKILKRRYRRTYEDAVKIQYEYTCGGTLANYISWRLVDAKIKFNKTADKLYKLDPECPGFRFKFD